MPQRETVMPREGGVSNKPGCYWIARAFAGDDGRNSCGPFNPRECPQP
jgi:hypothetical protein